MARKPKVTTNPVANAYTSANERIIEYSNEHGAGGLMALRTQDDGSLLVNLYRHDEGVDIRVSPREGEEVPKPLTQLLVTLEDGQQVGIFFGNDPTEPQVHVRSRLSGSWSTPLDRATNNDHERKTYHTGEWS